MSWIVEEEYVYLYYATSLLNYETIYQLYGDDGILYSDSY